MSRFQLKILACISMLFDHLAYTFLPSKHIYQVVWRTAESKELVQAICYTAGRTIGRLAFPIFAFLLIEGFFHTRNVKKYLMRLGIAALVSEVPFDMMCFGKWFQMDGQNVIFTLFFGLAAVSLIDWARTTYRSNPGAYNVIACGAIIGSGLLAMVLKTDYAVFGVLVIICFYYFRNKKGIMIVSLIVLAIAFLDSVGILELVAPLSMIPIFMYNGKKGKDDKYLLYAFYPLHLAILGLINMFVR